MYTHSCSQVPCSRYPGSQPRPQTGVCECSLGYQGDLQWSYVQQRYLGNCTQAVVPQSGVNATARIILSSIECKEGYYGAAIWNKTSSAWVNTCHRRDCPANSVSVGFPKCACKWGYSGSVVWNTTILDYTSTCYATGCPPPALLDGDGHCRCPRGTQTGLLSFTAGDAWTVNCTGPAQCPDFAYLENGDCHCQLGFSGNLQTSVSFLVVDFNETSTIQQTTQFEGQCNMVKCPAISAPGSFPNCSCPVGYSGNITWDARTKTWNSTCAVVQCPANATEAPACACSRGFVGTLTFNFTSQQWQGTCDVAPCVDSSSVVWTSGLPVCKCDNGYSGRPLWDAQNGWVHTCSSVKCPALSEKVTSTSAPTDSYQVIPGFEGCHDGVNRLGLIPAPVEFQKKLASCGKPAYCMQIAKLACEAVIAGGSECWGFSVSENSDVQLYNSLASDYTRCDPDNGLYAASGLVAYRRRALAGDCRCVSGYGGAYIWTGHAYEGMCNLDECPSNSKCGRQVQCNVGYAGSSLFSWDYANEKWLGQCQAVECGPVDIRDSFPSCECDVGYAGGKHGWDTQSEIWTGSCTKIPCVENSDQNFPYCMCSPGFIRSDGVVNRPVGWNGTAWKQSCIPAPCPYGAEHISRGECQCSPGFKGTVSFDASAGTFAVSQGSHDMKSCARVPCPGNSTEIVTKLGDGSIAVECKCNNGFTGAMTWDFDRDTWGSCARVDCPDHSSGHPNCLCDAGYSGDLTWNGTGYKGQCQLSNAAATWLPLVTLANTFSCTRVKGSGASTATPMADSNAFEFDFGGPDGGVNLLRCDIHVPQEFTKVRGSFVVTPLLGAVQNFNQTVAWGSAVASSRFVSVGTNYNIIDGGMEGGATPVTYSVAHSIVLHEAAVTQTDTIRFEVSQAAGVSLKVSDIDLSVYAIPNDVVKCVKTSQTP